MDELENQQLISKKSSSVRNLPWQVKLFLITLITPSSVSFDIGSFHLTPNTIFLLLFFIPSYFIVKRERPHLRTDTLMLLYGLSMICSLIINHGLSKGLDSGGVLLLRSTGAYFIARSIIQDKEDFVNLVKALALIVFCMSFVTIPEAITGKNLLRSGLIPVGERMGLNRAYGTFDHPILYGVFCASIFALYFTIFGKALKACWIILATFMSVSTGALVSILVQCILLCWKRMTASLYSRWKLFSSLLILSYITVDLLSNRTPIRVFLHRLTFSADTAYFRLTQWEWGIEHNVKIHPWFGIGFSEWIRPEWMYSQSIDNFWLVNMIRYGLPTFYLLMFGVILLLFAVGKNYTVDDETRRIRAGWMYSMIGTIIAGCTVHFWNSLYVWFFFLLGSGAWIASSQEWTTGQKGADNDQ